MLQRLGVASLLIWGSSCIDTHTGPGADPFEEYPECSEIRLAHAEITRTRNTVVAIRQAGIESSERLEICDDFLSVFDPGTPWTSERVAEKNRAGVEAAFQELDDAIDEMCAEEPMPQIFEEIHALLNAVGDELDDSLANNCKSYSNEYYENYFYQEPFPVFAGKEMVRHGLWDPKPPRFEELELAYQSGKYQDYSGFVDYLIKRQPGLKDRFVLVHHSDSQHMSSFDYPRVIVYQGATFYAFSDHPAQKDRRVEIMQARPDSYETEFKEIVFGDSGVEFRSDPKSCTLCHGSPAKPLWSAYSHWVASTYGDYEIGGSPEERAYYQEFLKQAPNLPATRHLRLPQDGNLFDNIWGFSNSSLNVFFRNWIGQNLTPERLNSEDGLRLIGILGNCEEGESFGDYESIALQMDQSHKVIADYFLQTIRSRLGWESSYQFEEQSAQSGHHESKIVFRTFLEQIGISTASFTPSLIANRYLIGAPGNSASHLLVLLHEVRPELFEDVKWEPMGLDFFDQKSLIDIDCESLEKKLKNIPYPTAKLSLGPPLSSIPRELPVMSRCTHCHIAHIGDPSKVAPAIPFNDAYALSQELKNPERNLKAKILQRVSSHGPDQMPPGQGLTADEIESMKDYLEGLE